MRRDAWLEMLADYLSQEARFTTDATVPDGLSTVEGLRRAAADYRGAVDLGAATERVEALMIRAFGARPGDATREQAKRLARAALGGQ